MTTNIGDTRCRVCSLVQPCPCDVAKGIHEVESDDKGFDVPIIILNKKRKSVGGASLSLAPGEDLNNKVAIRTGPVHRPLSAIHSGILLE